MILLKQSFFRFASLLILLGTASHAWSLVIFNETAAANNRFSAGYPSAPVPNTSSSFVGKGFDFSGVGWSALDSKQSVTMVSAQYFVAAAHHEVPVGSNLIFLNRAGQLKTYKVTGYDQTQYGNGKASDVALGHLSAPIPASDGVSFYPILALPNEQAYLNLPVLVYGWSALVGINTVSAFTDHSETSSDQTRVLVTNFRQITNYAQVESGDSGSPTFIPVNGALTLVAMHYAIAVNVDYDSFIPFYVPQLNKAMAATGASLTLTNLSTPVASDVAVGRDNGARVLSNSPSGQAQLETVRPGGGALNVQTFPGVESFAPGIVACGSDGFTRLISRGPNGAFSLWLMNPDNTLNATYNYGATARSIIDATVGADDQTRIISRYSNGAMNISTLDNQGGITHAMAYGPYPGWTPKAASGGHDDLTRVIWGAPGGACSLWLLSADNRVAAAFNFRLPSGWNITDAAVAVDNRTRILWTHDSGAVCVRTVDNAGHSFSQAIFGPYSGWAATSIAAGNDGYTRLVWMSSSGARQIWLLTGANLLP